MLFVFCYLLVCCEVFFFSKVLYFFFASGNIILFRRKNTRLITTSNLIKLRFSSIQDIFSWRRKQVHLIPVIAKPLVQKKQPHDVGKIWATISHICKPELSNPVLRRYKPYIFWSLRILYNLTFLNICNPLSCKMMTYAQCITELVLCLYNMTPKKYCDQKTMHTCTVKRVSKIKKYGIHNIQ